MNLSDLESFILKRKRINNDRCGLIGPEIKKRRKQLSKTQDEISEGICCVSYLSKVENNLITPNSSYISDIMERMDIHNTTIFTTDIYEKYLNALTKDLFYHETKISELIYNKIKSYDISYLGDLLRFMYYVNKENNEEAKKILDNLFILKENMEEKDLEVFIVYLAQYYDNSRMYFECGRVLQILLTFDCKNKYEQGVIALLKVKADLKLERYFSLRKHIHDYEMICLEKSAYKNIEMAKRFYYLSLLFCNESKKFTEEIKTDLKYNKDTLLRAYGLLLFHKELDAIELLSGVKEKSFDYYILLMRCYDLLFDRYKIKKIIQEFKTLDLSKLGITKLHYFNIIDRKYNASLTDEKIYIRDVALPYYYTERNMRMINYCISELEYLFAEDSQYKSIYLIMQRSEKINLENKQIEW